MELMNPIVIIICLVVSVILYFKSFKKRNKYTQGRKVANTSFIKETPYYKSKVKKYKILSNIIKLSSVLCIIFTSILIARPVSIQTRSENKYNRDIIIGMDISTSQCEVNLELIKKFKQTIPSIEGDRIGIVIFNTAPVVFCPLTDDYDYINECLDTIEKELGLVVENGGEIPFSFDEGWEETFTFWNGGTVANNEERGSSLVGDGLSRKFIFISRIKR